MTPGQSRQSHRSESRTACPGVRGTRRALRPYERAARAGDSEAMLALAVELLDADPDEAARWLDRAIAAGSSTAMLLRGLALRESDPAAERAWYERAIRSGGTPTLNMLATLHAEDDPERARAWLRLSRDAGDPNAGYIEANLGCLLEFRDVDAARAWHECSARAGHVDAMLHLGELLHDRDPDASRSWYERAVEAAEGIAPAEPPAAE